MPKKQKRKRCTRDDDCVKSNKHRGNCKVPSEAVSEAGSSRLVTGFEKMLNKSALAINDYLDEAREDDTLDLNKVVQAYENSSAVIKFSRTNIEERETKTGVDLDVDIIELSTVGFQLEPILKLIKAQLDASRIHTSEYGRAIRQQLRESLTLVASNYDDTYVEETMNILKNRAVDQVKVELRSVTADLQALPASQQPAIVTAREKLQVRKEELQELLVQYTGKKTVSSVAPKFRLKKQTPLQRQMSKGLQAESFIKFD